MIKKLSALLVILIFVLSLAPLALADNDRARNQVTADAVEIVPGEETEDVEEETEEPTIAPAPEAEDTATGQVDAAQAGKKPFKNTKQNLLRAKKQFALAKERFQEAREAYQDSKEQVQQLRKQARACLEDTEDCELKQKRYRKQTQTHLIHLADVILETLNKLKEKVAASEEMEDKDQVLADLEAQIEEVTAAKATLEQDKEDVTKEEIKEAVKTIKEAWKNTKPKLKIGAGKLINAKLGNIIVKIERLEAKFQKIRDRMESQGYDVSSLDGYVEELSERTALAKENWEKAKTTFQEARNSDNPNPLIKEAHRYQKEARKQIKVAKDSIRSILKEIKAQKAAGVAEEVEESEEEEEEVEEEEDEDEEVEESEADEEDEAEDEAEDEEAESTSGGGAGQLCECTNDDVCASDECSSCPDCVALCQTRHNGVCEEGECADSPDCTGEYGTHDCEDYQCNEQNDEWCYHGHLLRNDYCLHCADDPDCDYSDVEVEPSSAGGGGGTEE